MTLSIYTNMASLNAQRNLSTSQSALATSLQRLSSGLRINSAKDDAAGMAISTRMSTQINGLNQAVRNANDGISLAQTGDGSLSAITDNLQRIRELAVQAANSTNSTADRAAINQEVQQRLAEIDRVAAQTSFNGTKILDGSLGTAAFQVGANAGESIAISLGTSTSMRTSAIGAVAQASSGALGATATDGHIAATSTGLSYGTAGAAATAGKVSFTATTSNFAAATVYVAGTSTPQAAINVAHNFSTAGVAQVDGTNAQTVTGFDFSGAGLAQFDVNGQSVTLTTATVNESGLAAAIQAQLTGITVTGVNASGTITFHNTGSLTAVAITSSDANAVTAGFADSAGTAGTAATATTNATMTIDGVAITLDTDTTDRADLAAKLQTKMQASALGAGYTAAVVGSNIVISNATGGTNTAAVVITNADANAAGVGFANSAGVAGTAAAAGNPANLTIDGTAVALNANYGSFNALASAIGVAMGGSYTVTNTAGAITVSRNTTGAASTAVAITGADANAISAGMPNAAGTAGANAVPTTNATFYIDGSAVTLDQNYADQNAVATDIQSQLTGYTATNNAGVITIAKTGSQAAVNITGADTNATAGGFGFASGVAGVAGGSITLGAGDFTITDSSDAAVAITGTFTSNQALADAINTNVSGVYARITSGKLELTSAADITLGGAKYGAGSASSNFLNFTSSSVTANTGSLSTGNTVDSVSSNLLLAQVNSALTSVSALRGTFGAIQNRFDSTVSNLMATSENLSSARSRIQDTDFAAETANLTRNQILQQAGTAMLAQANALPQSVLALLK